MLLTAILGHEISHELLDPVVLHGRITASPDESLVLQAVLSPHDVWDDSDLINIAKQIEDSSHKH